MEIERTDVTEENPDGLSFIPEETLIGIGRTNSYGSGAGAAGTVTAGPLVAFATEGGTVPLPTADTVSEGAHFFDHMTNAEKLALPIDTPLDTRVYVTDWESVPLTGPKQILEIADPSDEGHWTNVD